MRGVGAQRGDDPAGFSGVLRVGGVNGIAEQVEGEFLGDDLYLLAAWHSPGQPKLRNAGVPFLNNHMMSMG